MGDLKDDPYMKSSMRVPWYVMMKMTMVMIIAIIICSAGLTNGDDQIQVPASGLYCISDCATCPVICSPPPPSSSQSSKPEPPPPPPLQLISPPLSLGPHHSPPQPFYTHLTPPPPSPSPRPPQVGGGGGSGSASPPPPPPPWKYYHNTPSTQSPPMVTAPHDYSYPYYYFYASDAKASSRQSVKRGFIFVMLLIFHAAVF